MKRPLAGPARFLVLSLLAGCGGSAAAGPTAGAPLTEGLLVGGGLGTFGVRDVGSSIGTIEAEVAPGHELDASDLDLPGGCSGFVSRQPDFILRAAEAIPRVRISVAPVEGQSAPLTLIVHAPNQTWHCAESGDPPAVEIRGAPAGQFDVWVGQPSNAPPAEGTPQPRGTLRITD